MFINNGKDPMRTLERLTAVLRLIDSKYDMLTSLEFVDTITAEQKAQLELINEIYKVYGAF